MYVINTNIHFMHDRQIDISIPTYQTGASCHMFYVAISIQKFSQTIYGFGHFVH